MDKIKRFAIVLSVIENLHRFESWSGETHIQKTVYFLEKTFPEVINYYPFILYKYGPFSFELRDDLGIMSAEKFIKITPRFPYGLRIFPERDFSEEIKKLFPQTLAKNENKIKFITKKLADKKVSDLEAAATALYVSVEVMAGEPREKRAEELCRLKPHISFEQADEVIDEVDKILQEVEQKKHNFKDNSTV